MRAEIAKEAASDEDGFFQLMGHLYRGEMGRENTWRDRLDKTSNWSVVITATLLTWAFSTERSPHGVILMGMGLVTLFLFIEARRYRMYDIWRSRVRLLEENLFANALDPQGAKHPTWRELLGHDLRDPRLKIGYMEALQRRLRRMYVWILLVLAVAWVVQLSIQAGSMRLVVPEAQVWRIPGQLVLGAVAAYYLFLLGVGLWPLEREAKGELSRYEGDNGDWKP